MYTPSSGRFIDADVKAPPAPAIHSPWMTCAPGFVTACAWRSTGEPRPVSRATTRWTTGFSFVMQLHDQGQEG